MRLVKALASFVVCPRPTTTRTLRLVEALTSFVEYQFSLVVRLVETLTPFSSPGLKVNCLITLARSLFDADLVGHLLDTYLVGRATSRGSYLFRRIPILVGRATSRGSYLFRRKSKTNYREKLRLVEALTSFVDYQFSSDFPFQHEKVATSRGSYLFHRIPLLVHILSWSCD